MAGMLTVIWWRDIPAQVIAKDRRRASKIVLHPRFEVAIDRAAVRAGRREMDAYIAEWHKTQRPCGDDLEAEARAEADRLEAEYTKDVLGDLAKRGGVAGGPVLPPPGAGWATRQGAGATATEGESAGVEPEERTAPAVEEEQA
jgi:hypothetical protein